MKRKHPYRTNSNARRKLPRMPRKSLAESSYWNTLGDKYTRLGLARRAIFCYKRCRSIAFELDLPKNVGFDDWSLLTKVGIAYQTLSKLPYAISYHEDSLRLARRLSDAERQLEALEHLRNIYQTLGYIHRAAACDIQRTNFYRSLGQRTNEARVLAQLGQDYDTLGGVDEAIETCEQSLAIALDIGDKQIESLALASLSMSYGHLGYAHRALTYATQSLYTARKIENQQAELAAMESLGDAYTHLDEASRGVEFYVQGLRLVDDPSNRYAASILQEKLGLAYMVLANTPQAIKFYIQGLRTANEISALYSKGRLYAHLGDAYTCLGCPKEAENALGKAQSVFDKVHMYRGYSLLTYYTANLFKQRERFLEAREQYKRAITLYNEVQDRYEQAQCLLNYARLLRTFGDEREAQIIAQSALAIYRERGTEKQVVKVKKWIEGT